MIFKVTTEPGGWRVTREPDRHNGNGVLFPNDNESESDIGDGFKPDPKFTIRDAIEHATRLAEVNRPSEVWVDGVLQ